MAVGFRAVGSWENGSTGLTADEVVAVPAAQVTGDLVIVLACWKDFSITAQVSGYTEITQFADGTTSTGNGTGSMKVGAWYKEATSDAEADPTVDFSTTTGLLGEATVIVFSKGAGESWLTPGFVTAAWPVTNATQTISASSTITVLSGGAVLGVLAIRDDGTFTRATTAIDDSAGAVTWNGNFAHQPATAASTTTGNDMSCDAGYRLITTGAVGVTLRQSATLAATETGSLLWVVLGTFTPDPKTSEPTAASLTATGATPTVTATANVASVPTAAALTATGATPTVTATANVASIPDAASLTATGATPTVTAPAVSQPTAASLAATGATPAVVASDNQVAVPTAASLVVTPDTPAVDAPQTYAPDAAALTITGDAPAIVMPVVAQPDPVALVLTGSAPAMAGPIVSEPTAAALALTGATPFVGSPVVAVPDAVALELLGAVPDVGRTDNILVTPAVAALNLALATPAVTVAGNVAVQPSLAALVFAMSRPLVSDGSELAPGADQIIIHTGPTIGSLTTSPTFGIEIEKA